MSQVIIRAYTLLRIRLAELAAPDQADRGDSPVPTAVIVAIIAAGAIVVAGAIIAAATAWTDQIPTSTAP